MQTLILAIAALQTGLSHTSNQEHPTAERSSPSAPHFSCCHPLPAVLHNPRRDKKNNASCALSNLLWDFRTLISTAFTCIPHILPWQHLTVIAEIPLQHRVWQTHLRRANLVQA